MPFAQLRGQPLYYVEHFHGPAGRSTRPSWSGTGTLGISGDPGRLVLVHGAGGTHLHWPPELRRMPQTTVYALDLPGHGKSAGAAGTSIAEKSEAIIALLDHLRLERAVIVGHSMGGAIAQTIALTWPERVAGLALVGTGAKLRVTPEILKHVTADFPRAVDTIIQYAFSPSAPERLTRLAKERMLGIGPQVLLADYAACDVFDVRERLGEIAAPTLVICGTEDRLTPEKYARFLAEKIPGAQLSLIPGGGHMVMLEQPQAVAQAIAEFVSRKVEVSRR